MPRQPEVQNSGWIIPEQMSLVHEHFCMAWTVMWRHSLVKTVFRKPGIQEEQDGPYLNVFQKLLSVLPDCLYFSLFSLTQVSWLWKNKDPCENSTGANISQEKLPQPLSACPLSCHSNSGFCVSAVAATAPQLCPASGSQSRASSTDPIYPS